MASIDGSVLIGCITAAKLGTGTNWRGSTHSFILHWQDQVRKYVALNPQKNALQDSFLLAMLQNAVNPVEELRIVKTQAEQMSVRDGKHLSYEQYVSLLLSAAQALDGHYTTKVNTWALRASYVILLGNHSHHKYVIRLGNNVFLFLTKTNRWIRKQQLLSVLNFARTNTAIRTAISFFRSDKAHAWGAWPCCWPRRWRTPSPSPSSLPLLPPPALPLLPPPGGPTKLRPPG